MATSAMTRFPEEVTGLLGEGPVGGVIGGESVASSDGSVFVTLDPGSGETLAEVSAMQAADVDRAVRAATEAFASTGWPKLSAHQRGAMLHRLADAVEKRKKAIVQHFGSPERFLEASREELEAVPGLPGKVAREVYAYVHKTG